MTQLTDQQLAAEVARDAGVLLVEVRRQALADGRPVGRELGEMGDGLANAQILAQLAEQRPQDCVLSEEAVDDHTRLTADRLWIVDPLDGSREFGLAGREDWAVHVALWERGRGLTAAAVALPALGTVLGAGDERHRVPPTQRVLISGSRPPTFVDPLCARLGLEPVPMGSAGAKAMAVVRGEADAYVHAGGQWEWDSAAPVGVATSLGLHASRIDGSPLEYNQPRPYLPDLVICRPELADRILAGIASVLEEEASRS